MLPVVANECLVRCFCLLRKLCVQMKGHKIRTLGDLSCVDEGKLGIDEPKVLPRMICVSSATFTAADVAYACVARNPLDVNVVGIGRLVISFGELDEDVRRKLATAALAVAAASVLVGVFIGFCRVDSRAAGRTIT